MPFDFQKNYDAELDLREKQRSAVAQPITILTIMGSIQGFMLQKFRSVTPIADALFWLALVAAAVALGVAGYFLIRAMHGHTYKRIPNAVDVRSTLVRLREWHAKYPTEPGTAEDDLDRDLESAYATAAAHNSVLNRVRGEYLFKAHTLLVVSVVATVVAFAPFVIVMREEEKPARVQIVSWPTAKGAQSMSNENQTPEKPMQKIPTDEKPRLPPLEDLKEGQIPRQDFDVLKESNKKSR